MTKTQKRTKFIARYARFVHTADMVYGIRLMPYSFHRTQQEQERLFHEGKSRCDGTLKRSKHQDWLAIDAVVVDFDDTMVWDGSDERYKTLAAIASNIGLRTGIEWGDANHTELMEDP
jgi:hypothetical protein